MIKWLKNLFKKKPPMYSILRTYYPEATTGIFLDKLGNKLCTTLELPWLDNQSYISCIPEGTYHIRGHSSAKWPNVWEVTNVLGRDAILLHWGNKISKIRKLSDVEGCILVGTNIKYNIPYNDPKYPEFGEVIYPYWITNSKATVNRLGKVLPSSFVLEIRKG